MKTVSKEKPKNTPSISQIIAGLNHPDRRRIMRLFHAHDEALSPNKLTEKSKKDVSLSRVSYHVKVLGKNNLIRLNHTRPARGALEHFYASNVRENAQVKEMLSASQAEDE